jgi:hypothetical protein
VLQQSDVEALATMVAATVAAAPADAQPAEAAPEEMPAEALVEIPEGAMQPLNECDDFAYMLGRALELTVTSEIVPVTMSWSGEVGGACQMTALGNGNDFADMWEPGNAIEHMMLTQHWSGGDMLMPCLGHGGGGPAAEQLCFVDGAKICEAMVTVRPENMDLCEGIDGPIGNCLAALSPEQQLFTITLTCAEGQVAVPLPKTEPERITFGAGATSAMIPATLYPESIHPYVLTAMENQQMTVTIHKSEYAVAVLSIWGADGMVLISDHAGADTWTGVLPATQDYYIDVISQDAGLFDYHLEVSVPPLAQPTTSDVFPKVEPFEFGYMQAIVGWGVPPMLPPAFPAEAGLPPVLPSAITTELGIYVFILEYGADCQGAGACHYGVIGGMENSTGVIQHFNTYYPFEAERAEQVELANGITGYFVESQCGASCSDATIWWLYDGYQYMLGLKAGSRDTLIGLASGAITNSVP